MSTKIDNLYWSMGLDVTELDADFAATSEEVNKKLKEFARMAKATKLETEVKINGLTGTDSGMRRLEVTGQSLSKQLQIQEQRVRLLTAAYQQTVNRTGEASVASQNMYNRLLSESRAYSQLENQIRRTSAERVKATEIANRNPLRGLAGDTLQGFAQGGLNGGVSAATAGAMGLASAHPVAAGAIVAVEAVKQLGSAMVDATHFSAQYYAEINKLAQRLGVSANEAYKFQSAVQLSGGDANQFASVVNRLNMEVLNAGVNGNDTTKALAKFGVTLTDEQGKLLPMTQIMLNLSDGYNKAAASGNGAAFAAQILGKNGQDLLPVLKNLRQDLQDVGDTDLGVIMDPDKVKQTERQLRLYNKEILNLKAEFGSLASEILPPVISLLREVNKQLAMPKGKATMADAAKQTLMASIIPGFGLLKTVKNLTEDTNAADKIKNNQTGTGGTNPEDDAETAAKTAKAKEELLKEQARKQQETEKALQAMNEETYRATHNTIQNQMHDIDEKAKKYRAAGVEEEQVTKYTEAAKAKVMQDYSDSTAAKIKETYQTTLEARLDAIDREKKAWQDKGVAEVEATKWAEEQKLAATRNAALEAIRNDRENLQKVRDAMKQGNTTGYGVDANGNKVQFNFQHGNSLQRVADEILAQRQQKLGIDPNDQFTTAQIDAYQQVMKNVEGRLVPGLESKISLGGSAGNKTYDIHPSITVQIDGSIVQDDGTVNKLADRVADKIQVELTRTLGGGSNGY